MRYWSPSVVLHLLKAPRVVPPTSWKCSKQISSRLRALASQLVQPAGTISVLSFALLLALPIRPSSWRLPPHRSYPQV